MEAKTFAHKNRCCCLPWQHADFTLVKRGSDQSCEVGTKHMTYKLADTRSCCPAPSPSASAQDGCENGRAGLWPPGGSEIIFSSDCPGKRCQSFPAAEALDFNF